MNSAIFRRKFDELFAKKKEETDQQSAAISQRTEFFVLSP
jgi:hypothetical protein